MTGEAPGGARAVAEEDVHPVPHPPVSRISPRARAVAGRLAMTPEQAQEAIDRGWLV